MVANKFRSVFTVLQRHRGVGVASKYEGEGPSPDEGADSPAQLPFRKTGAAPESPIEARAEVRDRETYYAELRLAVHSQSRSLPAPRAALEDQGADTRERRPDDESWDDMTSRFGDTWT